jgi:RNA polymerase sigma-70 factor (ECF subfamily)
MSSRIAKLSGVFPSLSEANEFECPAQLELPSFSIGRNLVRQVTLRLKSDEDLVADLLASEPDALTILFERHSALVFRIARRILRNDAEAEDALQQVFLDVFRAAEQFEPEKGTFKSWLLMFAYHRTFNTRRKLRTQGFYDSNSIEELPQELIEGVARQFPFAASEALILVDEALKLVQPRQRRTIELTYYEGLTAEEASEITGETVRVVRHNLYRGLEKLRSVLCSESPEASQKSKAFVGRSRP